MGEEEKRHASQGHYPFLECRCTWLNTSHDQVSLSPPPILIEISGIAHACLNIYRIGYPPFHVHIYYSGTLLVTHHFIFIYYSGTLLATHHFIFIYYSVTFTPTWRINGFYCRAFLFIWHLWLWSTCSLICAMDPLPYVRYPDCPKSKTEDLERRIWFIITDRGCHRVRIS